MFVDKPSDCVSISQMIMRLSLLVYNIKQHFKGMILVQKRGILSSKKGSAMDSNNSA